MITRKTCSIRAATGLLMAALCGCEADKTATGQSSTTKTTTPAPAAGRHAPTIAIPAAASANLASSKVTSPPVARTAGQSRRTGGDPVDDRVELRTYHFTNTDEDLPYAVFVSSKVTKNKKAPLVLALHGFGGNHGTFMRTGCVDEAEKNGYILIGAMGYSPSAPFGATMSGFGPGQTRRSAHQCACWSDPGNQSGCARRDVPWLRRNSRCSFWRISGWTWWPRRPAGRRHQGDQSGQSF
jgi:hypothetical protein